MIHHRIYGIVEASFSVLQEDRLNSTIPSIVVKVLELEHADIVELAQVNLLIREVSAAWICSTDSLVIWHDDEVSSRSRWLSSACESRSSEGKDQIIRSCAREVTTVLYVRPGSGRLLEVGPAQVINVLESDIVEVVLRNLVRVILIALEDD